ncbi:hypothetical protein MACK_001275 [Theileria orientalis]|uniref:Trafficking protein particle complex subunit n=1 Tax=Theileria orientalis TaxID=68886 RepID=A0A976MCR0_THEOR|nr:hypothetical protein MACK_001275 [Theileria orientalis]
MDHDSGKNTRNILQQSLSKQKTKVSLSAYSFLFSELVQYSLTTSTKDVPFTQRLHLMGFEVGCRILDALTIKDKITTRFTTIVPLLSFISTSVWKYLFNHQAVLMRGKDSYKEYMLNDKEFQITKYISMPKELQYSTCSSFIAGIVDGILSSAKFKTNVSAHDIFDNKRSLTILIQLS